jgi:hypothetical protein
MMWRHIDAQLIFFIADKKLTVINAIGIAADNRTDLMR